MSGEKDGALDFAYGDIVDNRYQIISLLGMGSLGRVYKAKHTVLNKEFAIKFIHPHNISESSLARFKLEAQASGLLEHKHIIDIHDYGITPDGFPYISMEYIEGESLADAIDQEGSISRSRLLSIFDQVLDGLYHAHNQGVLHRDIKPANILLKKNADGTEDAKILDFGLAKFLYQKDSESSRITATGEVVGSPFYMSPEQCLGKDLSPASDIYAIGVVLHEALTGVPVFIGKNPIEIMQHHLHSEAHFPEDAAVTPELQKLVLKCLLKDPKKRYQTAKELKEALAAIKESEAKASAEFARIIEKSQVTQKGSGDNAVKKRDIWLFAFLTIAIISASIFVFLQLQKP